MKPEALASKLASIGAIARRHPAALNEVLVTSGETGAGIAELRAVIHGLLA
jgi:GTP-binding protein